MILLVWSIWIVRNDIVFNNGAFDLIDSRVGFLPTRMVSGFFPSN